MRIVVFITSFLFLFQAFGQQYPLKKYSMKEGMPHTQALVMYQDSPGYLWVGTMGGGASRFNGKTFTNFDSEEGLTNSIVRGITQDSVGRMWLGTMGGGLHYIENDSVIAFPDSLLSSTIYSLYTDTKGNVWVGHAEGIAMINSTMQVEPLEAPEYAVTHVTGDANGNVWFNYNDRYGVFKYDYTTITVYDSTKGMTPDAIMFTNMDKEGLIWVGTSDGMYWLDTKGNEDSFNHLHTEKGIDSSWMFETAVDRLGNHVIGTSSKGLIRWNRKTDATAFVAHQNGMPTENVFRTIADRDGNVWLSPYGEGLVRFTDALFTHYSKKEGIGNRIVMSVTSIGDSIILATSGGLYLGLDGKYIQLFPSEITESASTVLTDSKGRIWYTGTNNLGYIYNGKLTQLDINHEIITYGNGLCEDNNGAIIISSWGNGIWKYTDKLEFVNTSDSLVTTHAYGVSVDPEDNLWVGSFGYGGLKIGPKGNDWFSYNKDISSDKAYTVKHANGKTYIGYNGGGLVIIENGKVIHDITKSDGLLHNGVVSLLVEDNTVWCGTVKGLNKVVFAENGDFKINSYSSSEGFTEEPMIGAMHLFNGKLLIGTDQGLYVYNKEEDQPMHVTPGMVIQKVALDYGETGLLDYCTRIDPITCLPEELTLPHFIKRISFTFEGISLNYANDLEYAYRLSGLDSDFSPLSKGQIVTFNDLKASNYTFEVYAIAKGHKSKVASYSFKVLKPFWEELWFIILVILVGSSIIYAIYLRKTAKLRKAKIVLENTVADRTKELVHQKELVEEKNTEILDSINYAKRIQSAILPPLKIVKEYLQESFILYKPKDVVAGDFYWMEHTNNKVLFAAADCTGHGVPGAMVSVVCNNALNRSVREYGLTIPGEILDKTREIVINEFEQSEEDVKDGMDIALCCLEGNTLTYSGAHNPLWIIRTSPDGRQDGEVIETKADKEPIGSFDKMSPYTTHTFELLKGDSLYLFSDGYPDQFGGERGKKFKTGNFKKLLISIQDKSMDEQREILLSEFNKWKGSIEQIDDVCVIGVRI